MELKLDNTKTYAIALEGGGAKGSYQIGVWQALEEAGIKFNAVSGTSVGSMNGAMMAMGDLQNAIDQWSSIKMSKVLDVDDNEMEKLMHLDIGLNNLSGLAGISRQVVDIIKNRGFDISPLRGWLNEVIDVKKIMKSDVELYITTVSLSDKKELEIRVKDLAPDEVCDMLIASSYLPAFRLEPLGGKYYADGGFQDSLPIHVLIENGYKDIITIRLHGVGIERRVRVPEDVTITNIEPSAELGSILNFVSEQSVQNLKIGYCDAMRVLFGLSGRKYYIERTLTDKEALDYLIEAEQEAHVGASLREICEKEIPRLARFLGQRAGSYYDIYLAALENEAAELKIDPYSIMSDKALMDAISAQKQ